MLNHFPSVGPKQLCALAHVGCAHEVKVKSCMIDFENSILRFSNPFSKVKKEKENLRVGYFNRQLLLSFSGMSNKMQKENDLISPNVDEGDVILCN